MCGIAGILDPTCSLGESKLEGVARSMSDTLRHRGPDGDGVWVDAAAGLGLGHRRLAIIDLSDEGLQPMHSADGRWVVTYNGEIYNFRELRKDLEHLGHGFRGHSDTEVFLAAVQEWGPQDALTRCNGMFALALWDRRERTLLLARDRMGEKPLYYGWVGGMFAFASELKALRRVPGFSATINRDALALYLRHNYVPGPRSIYEGIAKLPAGQFLEVGVGRPDRAPTPYWSLQAAAEDGLRRPLDRGDVVDQLEALARDAISLRMVADVPLGAFLSGGIDSSAVVALMQTQSTLPVRTFSIGFHESAYDEAVHARQVASHLGTDHTELYVSPGEAQAVIPRLPDIYDEPFADSSQIPTFLVSEMARRDVTVALSGDGGDELFAGYDRYRWARRIDHFRRTIPGPARRRLASALLRRPPERLGLSAARAARLLRRDLSPDRLGARIHRGAQLLKADTSMALYHQLMSHWTSPQGVVIGGKESGTIFGDPSRVAQLPTFVDQMTYLDSGSYLPDDILTKVDRASMAVSLEARVPFLDHRLVELAWKIPTDMKLHRSGAKWALRQVLYRHVPRGLVDRPKMGFGVPIDSWLRGPLRDWAESLLGEDRLRSEGYFRPEPIRVLWQAHLDGRLAAEYHLWDVLMFQAWLESN